MPASILHFIAPPIPYFIDCGQAAYAPGEQHIARHSLGVFDLIAVEKGSLAIGEDGQEWLLQEGDMLVLRPDGHHYGTAPSAVATEITWIHFQTFGSFEEAASMEQCLKNQAALIARHKQNTGLSHCEVSPVYIPKSFSLSEKLRDYIRSLVRLEHEPQSLRNWKRQSVFQSLLQQLHLEFAELADTSAIRLAEDIEGFIRSHYREPISNSLLSRQFNYHSNYLAKCMLKVYGMTPLEYLQQYRCEQAKKLLLQTSWPIARVAEESGFNSISYFSAAFTKMAGLSPGKFRRKFISRF